MTLRERKQQQAREQIVEAAFALFAERGFAQVSVTDIAGRAQVGRTTFFRYFGDKQEVLFADEQRLIDEFSSASASDAPAPRDLAGALLQLWGLAYEKREVVIGDRASFSVRQQLISSVPELQDRAARKMQRIAEALERVLLARGADPDTALLASQVGIACFRVALQTAGQDPEKVMPVMERVVRQVISTASPVP
ncbi:TetR family transcriptional regulator [Actinoplanes sp. TRM 88003]|uniref:TetR family transcriptional regulator n=1 Tax=Paractinoplanes aksuensis TaxID=2939490 RepID=A0ABT1DLE0_9ACTN|nr:TetR family transcriptional regulator [Actinoplanes aksuensis]MCO8271318.1 TetR family transcriptional regulator [Actinoplanes aksuensis]